MLVLGVKYRNSPAPDHYFLPRINNFGGIIGHIFDGSDIPLTKKSTRTALVGRGPLRYVLLKATTFFDVAHRRREISILLQIGHNCA